jgi:hypothetical protein
VPPTAVPLITAPHSHACHLSRKKVMSCSVFYHLPLCSAANTMATIPHPNPHNTPTPALPLTLPLDYVHRRGRTKARIKIATNITMAHTLRLALLQNDDPRLGQSYLLPPQFSPLTTLAPRPGPTYVVANTNDTPPSLLHLLPVHHHGRLYPVASNQPHKTAGMPNNESRRNPELFWMKFLFNFIYLFTIAHLIIQISAHYYTLTSPYHHHHSPFTSPCF